MSGQREFAQALLRPETTAPDGLLTWNGSDASQRFAIYRNNVTVSLIDALVAAYPVVMQLVGETFFREMARIYVRLHPPCSRIMLTYGHRFPGFIESFAPASDLPYLADVARLERARRRAYHAADTPPLGPSAYAALDPEALGLLTVRLHPSAAILQSAFAIVSLWAAHQGLMAIEAVDPCRPEDALIVRPDLEVDVVRLAPGVAVFLTSLEAGATVADAVASALGQSPEFDITTGLATLMASGVSAAFSAAGE